MFSGKLLLLFIGLSISASTINAESRPKYLVDILKFDEEAKKLIHICDGAILESRYVLTAANCVYQLKDLSNVYVRSGADLAPPVDQSYLEQRTFHAVSRIMYPSGYVNLTCRQHQHDIALLKVKKSFDLSYDALYKQVRLPEPTNDYENHPAEVYGYTNDVLKSYKAKVISNEDCAPKATSIITKGNLCAVTDEKYVKETSNVKGSALVYDNVVVGIKSGFGQCDPNSVGSITCVNGPEQLVPYTRVSAYLEFISQVLNKQVSSNVVYVPHLGL